MGTPPPPSSSNNLGHHNSVDRNNYGSYSYSSKSPVVVAQSFTGPVKMTLTMLFVVSFFILSISNVCRHYYSDGFAMMTPPPPPPTTTTSNNNNDRISSSLFENAVTAESFQNVDHGGFERRTSSSLPHSRTENRGAINKIDNVNNSTSYYYYYEDRTKQQRRQLQQEEQRKYDLPRIEVQFICNYDIRVDEQEEDEDDEEEADRSFDFTSTFHNMYSDVYFSHWHVDTELYTSVSMNDVSDVTQNHWYYPLCNQTSDAVLTTMEVKGFVMFEENNKNNGNSSNSSSSSSSDLQIDTMKKNGTQQHDIEYHEEKEVERLIYTISEHQLEDYFGSNVCNDLYFFRAQIFVWNSKLDPPSKSKSKSKPDSESHEEEQQEQEEDSESSSSHNQHNHSTSSQHSHHHHHHQHKYHQHHYYDFEHNLYLLCGGAEEIIAEGQPPDPGFMVIGVLVGIIMVGMIAGELHRPMTMMGSSSRSSRSRRLSSSSSSASTSSNGGGGGGGGSTSTSRRRDDYDTVQAIEMTMV